MNLLIIEILTVCILRKKKDKIIYLCNFSSTSFFRPLNEWKVKIDENENMKECFFFSGAGGIAASSPSLLALVNHFIQNRPFIF